MKTKKPKAWRECRDIDPHSSSYKGSVHAHPKPAANCTVIPDGAAIPLPADARRCIGALRLILEYGDLDLRDPIGPRTQRKLYAIKVLAKHDSAEKRRRGGK